MYTAFYGLREKPFSLTPDPRFMFLSGSHREALAHVLYGIEQGEGFIAVTGEVGTGKTTLSRTLLQRLGRGTEVAFVFNPTLTGEELLRAISIEFGLLTEGRSRAQLNDQLNEFLLETKRAGRRALLIVDEAQNLEPATLEEIRLLSNLETTTSKLLQIILFGQPELDDMLDSPELRQLRQRITVRWSLGALDSQETRDYVRHRLRIAAGRECDLFTDAALKEVRRRARGVPRLINVLCDRALLAGYVAGETQLGRATVDRAAREILTAGRRRQRDWKTALRFAIPAAAVALAFVAFGVGALTWFGIGGWSGLSDASEAATAPAVSAAPPVRPSAVELSLNQAPETSLVGASEPGELPAGESAGETEASE